VVKSGFLNKSLRLVVQGIRWDRNNFVKEFLTTAENQYYIQSKKQAGYINSRKTT